MLMFMLAWAPWVVRCSTSQVLKSRVGYECRAAGPGARQRTDENSQIRDN